MDADERQEGTYQRPIVSVTHTLPSSIYARLRMLAFEKRVSRSSILELALARLFEGNDDSEIARLLHDAGARSRRIKPAFSE